MSDDLTKLAEKVLRLDGEATAGPWHIERDLANDTTTLLGGEPWRGVAQMPFYAPHRIEANEDAITTYRTAAPTLARAVLDLHRLAGDLLGVLDKGEDDMEIDYQVASSNVQAAKAALRAALGGGK